MSVPTRAVWSRHEVAIQPGRCHAARQLLCRPGRCTAILDGPPPASKFTLALRETLVSTPLNQIMRPSHCPSPNVAVAARDAPHRLLTDGMLATDTIARSSAVAMLFGPKDADNYSWHHIHIRAICQTSRSPNVRNPTQSQKSIRGRSLSQEPVNDSRWGSLCSTKGGASGLLSTTIHLLRVRSVLHDDPLCSGILRVHKRRSDPIGTDRKRVRSDCT